LQFLPSSSTALHAKELESRPELKSLLATLPIGEPFASAGSSVRREGMKEWPLEKR
jgi:hypothetical protein